MLLIFRLFFFACVGFFTLTGVVPVEVGAVGAAGSVGAGRLTHDVGESPIGKHQNDANINQVSFIK